MQQQRGVDLGPAARLRRPVDGQRLVEVDCDAGGRAPRPAPARPSPSSSSAARAPRSPRRSATAAWAPSTIDSSSSPRPRSRQLRPCRPARVVAGLGLVQHQARSSIAERGRSPFTEIRLRPSPRYSQNPIHGTSCTISTSHVLARRQLDQAAGRGPGDLDRRPAPAPPIGRHERRLAASVRDLSASGPLPGRSSSSSPRAAANTASSVHDRPDAVPALGLVGERPASRRRARPRRPAGRRPGRPAASRPRARRAAPSPGQQRCRVDGIRRPHVVGQPGRAEVGVDHPGDVAVDLQSQPQVALDARSPAEPTHHCATRLSAIPTSSSLGTPDFDAGASASSGLPVSLTLRAARAPSSTGTLTDLTDTGTCRVTAIRDRERRLERGHPGHPEVRGDRRHGDRRPRGPVPGRRRPRRARRSR